MTAIETKLPDDNDRLLESILEVIIDIGPKAATMDLIARRLKISKRTLYEIFESKSKMIEKVVRFMHAKYIEKVKEIFNSTFNVMEGLLMTFLFQRDVMEKLCQEFFHDIDEVYGDIKGLHEELNRRGPVEALKIFQTGISQGMFRKDVNYPVVMRLMRVQMESLKRMELFFPSDITLLEAYDSIIVSFLRSIASPEGMKTLDSLLRQHKILLSAYLSPDSESNT